MTSTELSRWQNTVAAERTLSQSFIDGTFVDAKSGETFQATTPLTGAVTANIAACGPEDVDLAVDSARRAFDDGRWSRQSPADRKVVLSRYAALIDAHKSELAALVTLDIGKPISRAEGEVAYSAMNIQWMAEAVDKIYGEVAPLGPDALATITREPVGVVGAIVPWNFPVLMAAWKLGPALASGNSVVLKPAQQSTLVASRLVELASEAGLPDGVLNLVTGRGSVTGKALAEHMDVNAITFTGSTAVGKLIMRYAADSNLKKVSLELGGKSPTLVLSDPPNLDLVAAQSAQKIFGNSGQMCDALSRLVVHESVSEELVEKIVSEARNWNPSDPFDPASKVGTVVDEGQMTSILGLIDAGRAEGARVATGGGRALEDTGGYYVEPTVLDGVSTNMRVAREEIFGPVLTVLTFREDEEALKIAHDTEYGLVASVWTKNITKAHRIAGRLRAGAVAVNTGDGGDLSLPHGGFGQSGFGRDSSLHAFDNYTQEKATYINLAADL